MKKKLLSLVLALVMMLSMGTVAMADGASAPSDVQTITFTKNYVNAVSNIKAGVSPAETFEFEIKAVSVSDVAEGVTTGTHKLPTVSNVAYEEGDAGKVTVVGGTPTFVCQKDVMVTLPAYTSVGIYTYEITEKNNKMAGVDYFNGKIKLVVTVVQGTDGKIRVAAVHTEANGASKSDIFTNTYYAGNLSVKKTVTGNLGDQTKKFRVKVTFNQPEGKTIGAPITYEVDGDQKQVIASEFEKDGKAVVELTLKHDETVTFNNIPYGVTYTVEEANYTESDKYDKPAFTIDGATKDYTEVTEGESVTGYSVSGTIGQVDFTEAADDQSDYEAVEGTDEGKRYGEELDTVVITNNKDQTVDTGINLDSMPYILILAAVAVGGVAIISKKRKEEF